MRKTRPSKRVNLCVEGQYAAHMARNEQKHESLCSRCGACCGAFDDPCVHLRKKGGAYFCEVYTSRLGPRKTVGGEEFMCVSIREVINEHWPGDHFCAYKRSRIL